MSKTAKNQTYPTYSASSISINGKPKTSASISDGVIKANYDMSDAEKKAYDYAQKEFTNNIKNVNIFSGDTLANLNKQVEAYKQQGIKTIKELYNPILKSLKNDVTARFGNLDNSPFLDRLSAIEDKRADSIASLAQDVTAKQQELTTNELANRYAYLNFLNNYQNQVYSNAISSIGVNNNLLGTNNSYLNNAYNNSKGESFNLQTQLAQVAALFANGLL